MTNRFVSAITRHPELVSGSSSNEMLKQVQHESHASVPANVSLIANEFSSEKSHNFLQKKVSIVRCEQIRVATYIK